MLQIKLIQKYLKSLLELRNSFTDLYLFYLWLFICGLTKSNKTQLDTSNLYETKPDQASVFSTLPERVCDALHRVPAGAGTVQGEQDDGRGPGGQGEGGGQRERGQVILLCDHRWSQSSKNWGVQGGAGGSGRSRRRSGDRAGGVRTSTIIRRSTRDTSNWQIVALLKSLYLKLLWNFLNLLCGLTDNRVG